MHLSEYLHETFAVLFHAAVLTDGVSELDSRGPAHLAQFRQAGHLRLHVVDQPVFLLYHQFIGKQSPVGALEFQIVAHLCKPLLLQFTPEHDARADEQQ